MDRFLWLSGMYRGWKANPKVGIGGEVRALFESHEPEVKLALQKVLGQTRGSP